MAPLLNKTQKARHVETAVIRLWALTYVPMLFAMRPRVLEASEAHCVIAIPLRRRTRNHWGSMYIGALVGGADLAAGWLAMRSGMICGVQVRLIFKDMKAEFLKRPTAETHFECHKGLEIRQLIDRTLARQERGELTVPIEAICNGEKVAQFHLTLSIRTAAKPWFSKLAARFV